MATVPLLIWLESPAGFLAYVHVFKTAALEAVHERRMQQVDGRCKVSAWRSIRDAWKVLGDVCSSGIPIGGGVV
jgi:hypothetical protein